MVLNRLRQVYAGDFTNQLKYAAWGIIVLGMLLRITVYLQCNSMYIDEANIARNIFERSYTKLTQPLDYYQYAPPVFLWVVKTCTLFFGFSEYAYRIFPLFCGLLSLCLLYFILKYFTGYKGIWYALLLLAVGPIYVRYAQATKQYEPDIVIALVLILLALKNRIDNSPAFKLFIVWAIAGSIAIWVSMPSVFILAGVGFYYMSGIAKSKDFAKLAFLIPVGAIWLLQFSCYYLLVLKPQANTDYLQNFHKDYFFYLPVNSKIIYQDIDLFFVFISTVGGHQVLSLLFHTVCIILGVRILARTYIDKLLLVIIPLLALLFAAAIRQYSLIPRLTLFAMPLLLILLATGLQQLFSIKSIFIRLLVVISSIICIVNYNAVKNFIIPMQDEEMKQSLDFLAKKKITASQLYVEQLAVPAYVYYTEIYPERERWKNLAGATQLNYWATNFDSLAKNFPINSALLYSSEIPERLSAQQQAIRLHVNLTDSNMVKGGKVYLYARK